MERTVTAFASPEEAAREERRGDEALTPEERLQTVSELLLARGIDTDWISRATAAKITSDR